MRNKQRMEEIRKEYQQLEVPAEALQYVKSGIQRAKVEKKEKIRRLTIRRWGISMAAALTVVILPNSNERIANAMERIPIVGTLFEVITVREYHEDNKHNTVQVTVPEILTGQNASEVFDTSVESINQRIEEYTNKLVKDFKEEMGKYGYSGLEVSHETVTNTDTWFTLAIHAVKTQASGYEFTRYYHIDKRTGAEVSLKDLFQEGEDYVGVISENIKVQMKDQQDNGKGVYWLDKEEDTTPFDRIAENQSFYFDEQGQLVIVFDEYDVAPGYMGCPEFIITNDSIVELAKSNMW